jgi:hypothetical protein
MSEVTTHAWMDATSHVVAVTCVVCAASAAHVTLVIHLPRVQHTVLVLEQYFSVKVLVP